LQTVQREIGDDRWQAGEGAGSILLLHDDDRGWLGTGLVGTEASSLAFPDHARG
jgi:hypothetical protein